MEKIEKNSKELNKSGGTLNNNKNLQGFEDSKNTDLLGFCHKRIHDQFDNIIE